MDVQRLSTLLDLLANGVQLAGSLKIERKGRGVVTGAWGEKKTVPISFRLHNKQVQYKTPNTGWSNPRYGHGLLLLAGEKYQHGATTAYITHVAASVEENKP